MNGSATAAYINEARNSAGTATAPLSIFDMLVNAKERLFAINSLLNSLGALVNNRPCPTANTADSGPSAANDLQNLCTAIVGLANLAQTKLDEIRKEIGEGN